MQKLLKPFSISIISAIRLALQAQQMSRPHRDPLFDGLAAIYWTDVEVQGSIFVASLMTLRPLLRRFSLWSKSEFSKSKSSNPQTKHITVPSSQLSAPTPTICWERPNAPIPDPEKYPRYDVSWLVLDEDQIQLPIQGGDGGV